MRALALGLGLALTTLACTQDGTGEAQPSSPAPSKAASAPDPSAEAAGPDERPFLAEQASPPDERVLDDADACASATPLACVRLGARYEEGLGVPQTNERALKLYDWACEAGSAFACAEAGRLAQLDPNEEIRTRAPGLLSRACEGGHLHACLVASRTLSGEDAASMRARACSGGYLRSCDPGVKRGRKPPAAPPRAEDVCPGAFRVSARSGGGPRLHPAGVQLDHEGLLIALPSDVPGYQSEARSSSPAGEAGKRTAVAHAQLVDQDQAARRVSMTLLDLAADCTLQPGTGAAMQAHAIAQGASTHELGEHPAALREREGHQQLYAWVTDRCALEIDAAEHSREQLLELARYVNLRALGQLCRAREEGLRAGPL